MPAESPQAYACGDQEENGQDSREPSRQWGEAMSSAVRQRWSFLRVGEGSSLGDGPPRVKTGRGGPLPYWPATVPPAFFTISSAAPLGTGS